MYKIATLIAEKVLAKCAEVEETKKAPITSPAANLAVGVGGGVQVSSNLEELLRARKTNRALGKTAPMRAATRGPLIRTLLPALGLGAMGTYHAINAYKNRDTDE